MRISLLNSLDPFAIGEKAIQDLVAMRAQSPKDDPERRLGIHGPYEELMIMKTGKLPELYFDEGDPAPWGLRVSDSRSSILWQVLSGVLDRQPEFASSYMALALDNALSDDDYSRELGKMHKDFRSYMDHAGVLRDHHHRAMTHVYKSVACPACTLLASLAVKDEKMHALFKEMLPMSPAGRRQHLSERGLMPVLNIAIDTSLAARLA